MTSLPISFVVAFLLVLLTVSNHSQMKKTATGVVFALVLYLYAVSMVLIGVRWAWGIVAVLPCVATLSVLTSALLYLAFCSLGRLGPVITLSRDWLHLVPIMLVALNALLLPRWVDITLIASKLLYAVLLVRLACDSPVSLQLARLSWIRNAHHALWGAAIFLIISIALDIAIAIDFARFEGRHAANLVGFVNLMVLLLLGWVSVSAGRVRANDRPATGDVDDDKMNQHSVGKAEGHLAAQRNNTAGTENASANDFDETLIIEKLTRLLIDDRMYADTELNLQRLARKAGVPARTVSRVINARTGQNMSQWVNCARIDAVCALLKNSDTTVSEAMQEAGFLTKSNFNREFRRIKGCSPSEWRYAKQK